MARHRDGYALPIELAVSVAQIGADRIFTGILRELRDRKRYERNQAAQDALAGELFQKGTLEELGDRVAGTFGLELGFDAVSMWVAPQGGRQMECVGVWTAAVISMIHAYDLERVIMGGGVIAAGEAILGPVRASVARHAWTPWGSVDVVPAALGNDAGMLGVAWLMERRD